MGSHVLDGAVRALAAAVGELTCLGQGCGTSVVPWRVPGWVYGSICSLACAVGDLTCLGRSCG